MASAAAVALATVLAAPSASADAVRDAQWHLGFLDTAQAHEISQGQDVTVAVIDAPIPPDHPDIRGNVVRTKTFGSVLEDEGHGLAVTSLLAGHGHGPDNRDGVLGVAPEAEVVAASGNQFDAAIRWAVDQGAEVINVSADLGSDPLILRPAIEYSLSHDVVVVAAAGNAPADEEVIHPAAYPGVVAVGAVDRSGNHAEISVTGRELTLAAPGEDVMVPQEGGGYTPGDGTSSAAPMVAGAAALIRARYPDMNAASVVNRLIETADDKGPKGHDPRYGYGIIDPVEALTADIPNVQQNPLGGPAARTAPTSTASASPPGAAGDGGTGPGLALLAGIGSAAVVLLVGGILLVVHLTRRRTRPATPPRGYGPPGYPPTQPTAGPPPPYAGPPHGPQPDWRPPPAPPDAPPRR